MCPKQLQSVSCLVLQEAEQLFVQQLSIDLPNSECWSGTQRAAHGIPGKQTLLDGGSKGWWEAEEALCSSLREFGALAGGCCVSGGATCKNALLRGGEVGHR